MLLIAQPKSWSSSLLKFMEQQHKITGRQMNLKHRIGNNIPKRFEAMNKLHCCCVNVTYDIIKEMVESKDILYRQHIPPTEHNLKILDNFRDKIIVLLRIPVKSYYAYFRGMMKGYHPRDIELYNTDLYRSLVNFELRYRNYDIKTIYAPLDDIKINMIEKFYGFKPTKNPMEVFPKEKYTRG